ADRSLGGREGHRRGRVLEAGGDREGFARVVYGAGHPGRRSWFGASDPLGRRRKRALLPVGTPAKLLRFSTPPPPSPAMSDTAVPKNVPRGVRPSMPKRPQMDEDA